MAVEKSQIGEIKKIMKSYIPDVHDNYLLMIGELRNTEAYRTNQSFRETIEMLVEDENTDIKNR